MTLLPAHTIFFLLSYLFYALLTTPAYLLLRRFLPLPKSRLKRTAVWLAQSIAVGMIVWPADENLILTLPFYFAVLLACSTGSLLSRISVTALFFSLSMSISGFSCNLPTLSDTWSFEIGFLSLDHVVTLALWLLLYLLCRRVYPADGTYPVLSQRFWILTDLFTLLAFGTLLAVVVLPMTLNASFDNDFYAEPIIWRYFRMQILLISPLIFAGSLGALIAVVILSRHEQLERGQMLYEMNRAYYSQLEQTQLQVRRLRHDMANHLQAMRALDGDALHRYIDELIDSPAMRSQTHYCENTVVNAVLQNKEPRIAALHIDAEIAVSLPADLPIQDLDLCALFANGLDNAIEACARMPVHERRLSVRARADKGLLVVRMRNRTPDLTPIAPDDLPETHKRDRENHGFGLMNLRAIAARYQGSMELQRAGGMFELLVTLPLKEPGQI